MLDEYIKKYGVGLTGGVASGKSTVAKVLKSLGKKVFDADQLSREAVAPKSVALAQIVGEFGGSVLKLDGSLDRKMMRSLVFENPEKRKLLESIVHPAIHLLLEKKLKDERLDQSKDVWFYEASLIYETNRHSKFRQVWVAFCDMEVQIKRLMARDGIDRSLALAIVGSQMPAKRKAELADCVIDTRGSINLLESKIKVALSQLNQG